MMGHPAGVHEPGLHGTARHQRRQAQVRRDLRGGASLALLCGAEPLFFAPACAGGRERQHGNGQNRNQGSVPGLIRNDDCRKHQAGRDGAPVTAAAGVAARSFQVTSPSNALRPMVQMATGAACAAHQWQSSTTSAPANGSTASNTSFDCQVSLFSVTLHRIPWRRSSENARSREQAMTNPFLPRRKKVQDLGAGFARPADLQSQGSRKHSE